MSKPTITALRLERPGLVIGNRKATIEPNETEQLRWHAQGVEVVMSTEYDGHKRENIVLVPWNSIASVEYHVLTKRSQKRERQATGSSFGSAHSGASSGRAKKKARPEPSR